MVKALIRCVNVLNQSPWVILTQALELFFISLLWQALLLSSSLLAHASNHHLGTQSRVTPSLETPKLLCSPNPTTSISNHLMFELHRQLLTCQRRESNVIPCNYSRIDWLMDLVSDPQACYYLFHSSLVNMWNWTRGIICYEALGFLPVGHAVLSIWTKKARLRCGCIESRSITFFPFRPIAFLFARAH